MHALQAVSEHNISNATWQFSDKPSLFSLCSCCVDPTSIVQSHLQVFIEMGLLSETELEEVLVSEFNPVRGFEGISEITTTNVLNCGVSPKLLLNIVKERFLAAGG